MCPGQPCARFGKAGGRLGDIGARAFSGPKAQPGLALNLGRFRDEAAVEIDHIGGSQYIAISLDDSRDELVPRRDFLRRGADDSSSRLIDSGADTPAAEQRLFDGRLRGPGRDVRGA